MKLIIIIIAGSVDRRGKGAALVEKKERLFHSARITRKRRTGRRVTRSFARDTQERCNA
jgi:hypothetical protein